MESRSQDWITAASCHSGPRPVATFADLPEAHQADMMRVVLAAAATTAFLILIGLLMSRLPSRSLAAPVVLPHPVPARGTLIESHLSATFATAPSPSPSPSLERTRAVPSQRAIALAAAPAEPAPGAERRGNILSRFFRAFARRPAASAVKADPAASGTL